MPPESPEDVVAATSTHLEYIARVNDQLQQLKGRTQAVRSMLGFLRNSAGETEAEVDLDAITEMRVAAETLEDQIDYWIEETTSLRETVRAVDTTVRTAKLLTSSLTEIDEDLPAKIASLETSFRGYQDTTEAVNDNIETSVELLERSVILLVDTPEADEIGEIGALLTEHHREIKTMLQIE